MSIMNGLDNELNDCKSAKNLIYGLQLNAYFIILKFIIMFKAIKK